MNVVKNVSKISDLFSDFVNFLDDESVRSVARTSVSDFTRNKIFSVSDLLLILIFGNQNTMNRNIAEFFSRSGRTKECASKQALHQALQKMNPNVFSFLLKEFRNRFYNSDLVKTFKGYILLSEDGTSLEIPYSYSNLMDYRFVMNQHINDMFDVQKIVSKSAGVYDILNGFFADFCIRPATYSELPLAIQHIYRLKESLGDRPSIFLADRYYGSVELISLLEMQKMKYCIRAKSNFYKEQTKSIEKDGWITLDIDEKWLNRFRYGEDIREYVRSNENQIKLRVVKHSYEFLNEKNISETVTLTYFTNLSEEEFSTDEIVDLYAKRWAIETAYKTLKVNEEIERVNSSKKNIIECKIYAKILLFNMVGILRGELDQVLMKKKTQTHKNGFKANQDFLLQICLEDLYEICVKKKKTLKKFRKYIRDILIAASKKIVPVRPNRHYKRWGRFLISNFCYKFRLDGRNHPKVKNYKGGLITVSN